MKPREIWTSFKEKFSAIFGFIIGVISGLAFSQRQVERYKQEARTDFLTAVLNPRGLEEALTYEFERAQRFGRVFSILMIDLDHFKEANDRFGHAAGDIILKEFVRLVQEEIRTIDTLARKGGDEFILILPETKSKGARILAERLRRKIAGFEFHFGWGKSFKGITLSIGISAFPQHAENTEALVNAADEAVYQAKEEKNKVAVFGRAQLS